MKFSFKLGWLLLLVLVVTSCGKSGYDLELVNASYDPTRELYVDINKAFEQDYQQRTGKSIRVTQTHGGSGSQARAVIDGLKADVVTLALAGDIDAIAGKGLIAADWQDRLPDHSAPYTSTIVLMVRAGNPKGIKDWPDLIRPEVKVITPNPKTSGGARWNFLAAWGYVTLHKKGAEKEAREFIQKLYGNVVKLDTGARGATDTFVRRKQGDVLISWENEAIFTRKEMPQENLEIVYPSVSILAEPPVAWVDRYVEQRKTRQPAVEYLRFLYTPEAQDIIGRHGYRPRLESARKTFADQLPELPLFTIRDVVGTWADAQAKFFADGAIFDQIYQRKGGQ